MPSLDIPDPSESSDVWDSLTFKEGKTEYRWPEDPEHGQVEWSSFKSSVKVDKKSKAGAAKAKVTTTGGKPTEFDFTMCIVQDIEEARTSAARVLDKLRAGAGPFSFSYPWAAFDGVRGFMVEEVEKMPPADGELRVKFSCVEVDPDAQAGTGKNVVKTPSKEAALKRANDEWLARARQAQAFTNNINALDAQNRADAAAAAGDPVAVRVPKKLQSVFVGEDEIGASPNVPKQADPPGNVATGSVNG